MSKKARKLYIYGAVLIVVALVSTSFGIMISATSPNISTVIEPGSMVDSASYIIFTDGTTYYAKNGTTGAIESSSTNATLVIETAISICAPGGSILIKKGIYDYHQNPLPAPWYAILSSKPGLTLAGEGVGTIMGSIIFRINSENVTVRDIAFTNYTGQGPSGIEVYPGGDGATIEDVLIYDDGGHSSSFLVETAGAGNVIQNITFRNCRAVDTRSCGFQISGLGEARNVRFVNCDAINNGKIDPFSEWVVGFDLAEQTEVHNISVTGCRAVGAYESGFHMETVADKTEILITDSTSFYNGLTKPVPIYGAGFIIASGTTIANCIAGGNAMRGYYVSNSHDESITMANCWDEGSRWGFDLRGGVGRVSMSDCGSKNATQWAIYAIDCVGFTIHNFGVINPTGFDDSAIRFANPGTPVDGSSHCILDFNIFIPTLLKRGLRFAYADNLTISVRGYALTNVINLYSCDNVTVRDSQVDCGADTWYVFMNDANVSKRNQVVNTIVTDSQTTPTMMIAFQGEWIIDKKTVQVSHCIYLSYDTSVRFYNNWGYDYIRNGNTSLVVAIHLWKSPMASNVFGSIQITGYHNETSYAYASAVDANSLTVTVWTAVTGDRYFFWYVESYPQI